MDLIVQCFSKSRHSTIRGTSVSFVHTNKSRALLMHLKPPPCQKKKCILSAQHGIKLIHTIDILYYGHSIMFICTWLAIQHGSTNSININNIKERVNVNNNEIISFHHSLFIIHDSQTFYAHELTLNTHLSLYIYS